MAKEKKKKAVTRKEMSRVTRENRQMKFLTFGVILVTVLVVGILIYGILNEFVLQGMKTVATVNGEKISLSEFQKEVRYQRFQYIRTYSSYAQLYSYLGASMGSSLLSNLQSIESSLSEENRATFGQNVLDNMVDNIAIAQYAEKNGFTVSQEEIDKAIEEAFGYYVNGTPIPTMTITPFVTPTLSETQYALVSPTPTKTVVPATATVEPTLTQEVPTVTPGSPSTTDTAATQSAEATITATEEPIPTETPYTYEGFEQSRDTLLTDLETIGFNKTDLEQVFKYTLIREKVYESLTADVQSVQEQVWARHILVADEATAKEVLQKLNDGGDWAALAEEYSTDENNKSTGGDLGWFFKGKMVAPFSDAAFKLGIGEISEPVQTDYGWHLIQVLGHETRPLSLSDLNSNKDLVFNTWLDELTTVDTIKILDNWMNDVPVSPVIPDEVLVQTE